MNKERINELNRIAYELRKQAVTMVYSAHTGHAAPALSDADIIAALYFEIMKLDPSNPHDPDRDRFVLSKGHACVSYYAALAKRGFFPEEVLSTYRKLDSKLQGHPNMNKVPGVDMTSGSLGNGVSGALGMALVAKRENKDHMVYCIAGDGEIQEGITWEAFMSAAHYGLDNLVVFIDRNGLQSGGEVTKVMNLGDLQAKFAAFGWDVQTVDGHDIEAICSSVENAKANPGKPHVVICNTVKGKGVSYMEGQYLWHMKAPTQEQFEQAIEELDAAIASFN